MIVHKHLLGNLKKVPYVIWCRMTGIKDIKYAAHVLIQWAGEEIPIRYCVKRFLSVSAPNSLKICGVKCLQMAIIETGRGPKRNLQESYSVSQWTLHSNISFPDQMSLTEPWPCRQGLIRAWEGLKIGFSLTDMKLPTKRSCGSFRILQ